MEPEYGKDFILYMIEEIGECIAILKKKGSAAIMEDPAVREAFLSEMADVLMYYQRYSAALPRDPGGNFPGLRK